MERALKERRRKRYRNAQPPELEHCPRSELEEEGRGVVPPRHCLAAPSARPAPPRTTTPRKARSTSTSLPPPKPPPCQRHLKKAIRTMPRTPTAALLPCHHVCDCPLIRRIATNSGGCGGSRYSLSIALLASIAALTTPPGPGGIGRLSPPRHLLVGLAGRNCLVLLYGAPHFGSDAHLHHHCRDDDNGG